MKKYSYIFALTLVVLGMDTFADDEEGYLQKAQDKAQAAWDRTRTAFNAGWSILKNKTRPILVRGERAVYEELASFPPEAYSRDAHNRTPLMDMAAQGDLAKVELLIAMGADVNATDFKGKTVLMYAAEAGHDDVMKLLIENGAEVNARDTGEIWDGGLILLSNSEIDPHLLQDDRRRWSITALRDRLKTLAGGKEWGDGGRTALMYAIFGGHDRSVELLLNEGAVTGMRNFSNGMTDLMEAIRRGHMNIALLLINAPEVEIDIDINKLGGWHSRFYNPESWGGDLDARDYLSNFALMMAVEKNGYEVVRALVEKGVNVNMEKLSGRTPLMTAAQNGHFPIAALLMDAGAFIHTKDMQEQTALGYAVENGHHGIARFLLHRGADPNTRLGNWVGKNALIVAAENGDAQMVELLIKFDADIHATFIAKTPLMYAAESGDLKTVEVLLAAGAFVEARSFSSKTAIQYTRNTEVIQLLMQYQEQQTIKLKEN